MAGYRDTLAGASFPLVEWYIVGYDDLFQATESCELVAGGTLVLRPIARERVRPVVPAVDHIIKLTCGPEAQFYQPCFATVVPASRQQQTFGFDSFCQAVSNYAVGFVIRTAAAQLFVAFLYLKRLLLY